MSFDSHFLLHQNLLNEVGLIQKKLIKNSLSLSIAESCTGGFLSSCFTSFSGASDYFKGSLITYSNEAKIKFLDINKNDIDKYGVASKYIVELMVKNIQKKYDTDFSLATTGYIDGRGNKFTGFKEHDNYAWIAISNRDFIYSKRIVLNSNRIENIHIVSLSAFDGCC